MGKEAYPAMVKEASIRHCRKPRNLPRLPSRYNSAKAPGFCQYVKPNLSPSGLPPSMATNVKRMSAMMRMTLPRAAQNSDSPYHSTANRLINA